MNLILWGPTEITSLSQNMDSLMRESLRWPLYEPFSLFLEDGTYQWMPIDIQRTEGHLVVKASLPGVKLEDVDISINGDVLTIKGEIKQEGETKEAEYVRRERFIGEFCRTVELPEGLDTGKAEAVMGNGVLTLTIPRSEEAKPKSIKVKAVSCEK